jgi:hypothetical protein
MGTLTYLLWNFAIHAVFTASCPISYLQAFVVGTCALTIAGMVRILLDVLTALGNIKMEEK